MRVLVDANVVLDLALQREPFLEESERVLRWCEAGNPRVTFVAWHTVTNVYFIMERALRTAPGVTCSSDQAKRFPRDLLSWAIIAPANQLQAMEGLGEGGDLEDALQCICARDAGSDVIVTRDPNGFQNCVVRALSPTEFLAEVEYHEEDEPASQAGD
jgi:predicted nucleic acid-binding protein